MIGISSHAFPLSELFGICVAGVVLLRILTSHFWWLPSAAGTMMWFTMFNRAAIWIQTSAIKQPVVDHFCIDCHTCGDGRLIIGLD